MSQELLLFWSTCHASTSQLPALAMATPRKRATLSEHQRHQVAQHHIRNPSLTHENLADHVAREFGLKVSRTTISKLLKRKARHMGEDESKFSKSAKRIKRPENELLERALTLWLWKTEQVTQISDDMVAEKARELAKDARLGVGADFKLSNGWLEKLKRRIGIKSYHLHGERGSVDEKALEEARAEIRGFLADYELKDICNMDETGLCYRMSPSKTLATHQRKGAKKSKERVTLALCSNADGSDKMPPLVIGKSKNPRCFKSIRRENLGAYCRSNSSAWMTGSVFAKWVGLFSQRVRGRSVILLVDNASSHHVIFDDLDFRNGLYSYQRSEAALILFLPPNMTSALQPMDMGVIASLKTLCRSFFIKWKLKEIESGIEKPRLNLLQAIRFALRAWSRIEDKSVSNCFRKSGILTASQAASCYIECKRAVKGVEKAMLDELADSLIELKIDDCLTAEEFAFPDGEQGIEEAADANRIIEGALGEIGQDDEEDESSEEEVTIPAVGSKDAIFALDTLWFYFKQTEQNYPKSWSAMDAIWGCIDDNVKRSRKQRKITGFFILESSKK